MCPDTSAKPPSPPEGPPVARIVPANEVFSSDQTTTLPPVPLDVAEALMTVLRSMVTVAAVGIFSFSRRAPRKRRSDLDCNEVVGIVDPATAALALRM